MRALGAVAGRDPKVAVDWDQIAVELRSRETRTLRYCAEHVAGVDTREISRLLKGKVDEDTEEVLDPDVDEAKLIRAIRGAFAEAMRPEPHEGTGRPNDRMRERVALVAAFTYALGLEIWELSSDRQRVRILISAVEVAIERSGSERLAPLGEAAAIVELYQHQLETLTVAMQVEDALNRSDPAGMRAKATEVLRRTDQALSLASQPGLRDLSATQLVAQIARAERVFFGAVIVAAEAAEVYAQGGAQAPAALERCQRELLHAEQQKDLRQDVYQTEIRAHRLTVEAMQVGWPRLHVGRARIVYCYPFAVFGLKWVTLEAKVFNVTSASPEDAEPWVLGGMTAVPSLVSLSDMWIDDALLCRALVLRGLRVETDKGVRDDYEVEIRFNRLGNHYLRIAFWEDDATVHHLHRAMRRASEFMGTEAVTAGDGTTSWPRTFDNVADFASTVLDELGHKVEHHISRPPARVHVTVAVRDLSVEQVDGERRAAGLEDLAAATGTSLLFQPIGSAATSIDEWLRYPTPDVTELNQLEDAGFDGDVLVRTPNTTAMFMPGQPDFMLIEYEEMADFVATLPAFLHQWTESLHDLIKAARDSLDALHDHIVRSKPDRYVTGRRRHHRSEPDPDILINVEDHHLELRRTITEARVMLARVRSGSLIRTGTHRRLLDRLLAAAQLPLREADLQAEFDAAGELLEQLAGYHRLLEEGRRRRTDARHSWLLTLIGVPGLITLYNYGWDTSRNHARFEVGGIVLTVTILVLVSWVVQRIRSRTS